MIAKKVFNADGSNTRFLSDFIIQSEQFCRVYVYIYDNTLNPDGTEDVLQNGSTNQSDWSFPDNIWKRGADAPDSGDDLLTIDKWDLVTNSILTYDAPISPSKIWIEVATTPEEFGTTLTQPSVERAETASTEATASAVAAYNSEVASAASASASADSATESGNQASASADSATASATSASASATSASESASSASASASSASAASTSASSASTSATAAATSASQAATSATNASASETAAATSATNAATSETNAGTSATNAQLRAWEAEAEKMTADSYATEAEDVFVNVWTSDGDGTFTATPTTEYSSLHWQAKAQSIVSTGSEMMIGDVNIPLLDMPLNNSLALKQGKGGVFFERLSTATYIDMYGVLQTAAIDEPRFEEKGFLVEGDSTNKVLQSEQFDNASWNQIDCTITADAVAAPDGNTTADRINWTDSLTTRVTQTFIPTIGSVHTASIFVKELSSPVTSIVIYTFEDDYFIGEFTFATETMTMTQGIGITNVEKLANGWYRLSMSVTLTGATSCQVQYGRYGTANQYIWGGQVEALPFASSYIPTTTTAVTRAEDKCYMDYLHNMVDAVTGDVTIAIDVSFKNPTAQSFAFSMGVSADLTKKEFRTTEGTGQLEPRMSNLAMYTGVLAVPNTTYRMLATYNGLGEQTAFIDGVFEYSRTEIADGLSYVSDIALGHNRYTNAHLNGHIKNFRIWAEEFTTTKAIIA